MTSLFGGSKTESTTKDLAPKELEALRQPLAEFLLGFLDPTGGPREGQRGDAFTTITPRDPSTLLQGLPQYQGQTVAPITGAEQTALRQLRQQTGPGTARAGLLDQTLQGQFLTPESNPFLQAMSDAANRQTTRQFEETLTRSLPSAFTRGGQNVNPGQSSAFDRAAAIQSEGLANALADTNARIFGGAYEAERGRQQEAVSLDRAEVDATVANLQAQALPRFIEQFGLDRGLEMFQFNMQAMMSLLSIVQGLTPASLAGFSQGQTDPNIVSTITNPLNLGGAISGAAQ